MKWICQCCIESNSLKSQKTAENPKTLVCVSDSVFICSVIRLHSKNSMKSAGFFEWNSSCRSYVYHFICHLTFTHKDERKGELCVGCLFGKLRFYTNIFSLKCDNHINTQWIILVSWMNLKSKTNVRLESSSSFVVIISKTLFWWTALIFLELLFFVLLLFPLYLTMNTKFRSEIFRSVELLI